MPGGLLVFLDAFDAFSGGGQTPLTSDELVPILQNIKAGFMVINDALDHADREANLAVTAATDAATDAEAVGQDLNDITGHTYRVVIPHSLSWLAGYVVTTWIDPLRKQVAGIEHQVKFLMGWRGQIDTWRHKTVDPELKQWVTFDKWFKTWPTKLLTQWHAWMLHPADFGKFWAPYIVRPLVAWLGTREHTQERDILSTMLVQSWSDDPTLIWDAVLRWAVAGS